MRGEQTRGQQSRGFGRLSQRGTPDVPGVRPQHPRHRQQHVPAFENVPVGAFDLCLPELELEEEFKVLPVPSPAPATHSPGTVSAERMAAFCA